jgi:hypothetical protein
VRPYLEKKTSQKRAGGMAQGVGPEFKHQYHTHKIFLIALPCDLASPLLGIYPKELI